MSQATGGRGHGAPLSLIECCMSVVPAVAVMEQTASLARPGHATTCSGLEVGWGSLGFGPLGPWGWFRVLDQGRHRTVLEAEACWPVWL